MLKQCSKCDKQKSKKDFYNAHRYKDGKYPSCKRCCRKTTNESIIKKWGTLTNYYSEYRNRIVGGNPSIIFTKKRSNANAHGIEFTIDRKDFIQWYNSQALQCYYCDIKQEQISRNQALMPNINIHRLTLDRIDPMKGYVAGNIVLCCARCNLTKNNFFTDKQMREIAQKYIKPRWNKNA